MRNNAKVNCIVLFFLNLNRCHKILGIFLPLSKIDCDGTSSPKEHQWYYLNVTCNSESNSWRKSSFHISCLIVLQRLKVQIYLDMPTKHSLQPLCNPPTKLPTFLFISIPSSVHHVSLLAQIQW